MRVSGEGMVSSHWDEEGVLRLVRRAPREYEALTALQRVDGSWRLDLDLARAVGGDVRAMRASACPFRPRWLASGLLATATALLWLRRHAAAHRDEWAMAAETGEVWLGAALASSLVASRSELDAVAETLVG